MLEEGDNGGGCSACWRRVTMEEGVRSRKVPHGCTFGPL